MEMLWRFRCDLNHEWTVSVEGESEPTKSAATCPVDGSPAVTGTPQPPADRVSVKIVPAARIIDAVTNSVGYESEYFLEIASVDSENSKRSARTFGWEEAVRKAGMFQKASWEQAAKRWQRMGLDRV